MSTNKPFVQSRFKKRSRRRSVSPSVSKKLRQYCKEITENNNDINKFRSNSRSKSPARESVTRRSRSPRRRSVSPKRSRSKSPRKQNPFVSKCVVKKKGRNLKINLLVRKGSSSNNAIKSLCNTKIRRRRSRSRSRNE